MRKINTAWIMGMNGEEREDFEATLRNNTQLFQKLLSYIDHEIQKIYDSEASEEPYNKPNWAEWQAHQNGRKQQLRQMRKLCEHIE